MALKLPAPPWQSPSWQGAPSSLDDVIANLDEQRQARELALQLRLGIEDARAQFAYLRVKGLRTLGATVSACVADPEWTRRFKQAQLSTDLQSKLIGKGEGKYIPLLCPQNHATKSACKSRLFNFHSDEISFPSFFCCNCWVFRPLPGFRARSRLFCYITINDHPLSSMRLHPQQLTKLTNTLRPCSCSCPLPLLSFVGTPAPVATTVPFR